MQSRQPGNTDIHSYDELRELLNLYDEIPYTPDWSAAADFLKIISDYCLQNKPASIFECSSGLSTLVLARCCQINNYGKVYSLEDGEEYANNISQTIKNYKLEKYASITHASLEKIHANNTEYLWYNTAMIPAPDQTIDMLVIDGPSGFIQKNSRYPALPMLYDRLSKNSIVFLDDAARVDEKEIAELWKSEYPAIEHEYIDTERGCSIFRIKKDN